jgi:hypothetical protein
MMKSASDAGNRGILILAVIIATITSFNASAALGASGSGTAGASFLSLPVGAQSIALGEASAALLHDPFTWLSNPGLMPLAEGTGAGAFHSQWALDTYYDNAIARRSISKLFSIGAGFTYLSTPDVPGFDEVGNPTSSLSNSSLQGILGVGITPLTGLGVGADIKYIQDKIADWTARGCAIDIGAAWTTPFHELTLGIAVQNIGNDIKFIEESEKLPTSLRMGASGAIPIPGVPVTMRFAADLVKPRFEDAYGCFGAEADFRSIVFLRAGYTDDASREGDRFSVGGGFKLFDRIVLDYAWTPYGTLGSFNRISFYVR